MNHDLTDSGIPQESPLDAVGISYASGPNYNMPWELYDPAGRQMALEAAYDAMQGALRHIGRADPAERAIIEALQDRYPQREPVEDMLPWNKAYTNRMRRVYEACPGDLDVCSIFVESIMNETP